MYLSVSQPIPIVYVYSYIASTHKIKCIKIKNLRPVYCTCTKGH